jgi:catechol 2,3-dioxygenase-like lactoylglutathione lyase family enzyme
MYITGNAGAHRCSGLLFVAIAWTPAVCTRNRDRATAFYRDTLGLVMAYEDRLADLFNMGGITLRISTYAPAPSALTFESSAERLRVGWRQAPPFESPPEGSNEGGGPKQSGLNLSDRTIYGRVFFGAG